MPTLTLQLMQMQVLAEIALSQTRDRSICSIKHFDAGDLWQSAPGLHGPVFQPSI